MEQETTLVQRLGLLANSNESQLDEASFEDFEQDAGYRAYSITRGHPAAMLGLAFRSGDFLAFSYAHLYRIDYSPTGRITLRFTDDIVAIEGIRIRELYRRLLVQRIVEVVEADSPTTELTSQTAPVVHKITVLSGADQPAETAEE